MEGVSFHSFPFIQLLINKLVSYDEKKREKRKEKKRRKVNECINFRNNGITFLFLCWTGGAHSHGSGVTGICIHSCPQKDWAKTCSQQ